MLMSISAIRVNATENGQSILTNAVVITMFLQFCAIKVGVNLIWETQLVLGDNYCYL